MTRMSKYVYYYKYSKEAREVISLAREEALRLRHRLIGTEHLLLSMLRLNHPLIESLFVSLNTSPAGILQALDFVIGRGRRALVSEPVLSTAARATLARAEEAALAAQADLVGIEHVLLGMLDERDGIVMGVFESLNIYPELVRHQLRVLTVKGYEHLVSSIKYRELYDTTPTLNLVSRDLTLEALNNELDPLIGREAELERTMQILSRRSKNNPVLIGPAGVGKTAIAEGLAQRIIAGQVPENLRNRRVVTLDVGLLTVGTRFRGDFEERLKRIMQEILQSKGIIIVIDELQALVGTGVAEGSIDAANLFKPMLARGEFQCIGATTVDDYRKSIEADPALERRFQPVLVSETTPQETLEILHGLRPRYEDFHQVTISDEALRAAVQMSSCYIQNRYQPDKAIDLVDEAAARACVNISTVPGQIRMLREELVMAEKAKDYCIAHRDYARAARHRAYELQIQEELREVEHSWAESRRRERPVVGEQEIAQVVAMRTGIPAVQIAAEEAERLLQLEESLQRRVIGQHEAVKAVARPCDEREHRFVMVADLLAHSFSPALRV